MDANHIMDYLNLSLIVKRKICDVQFQVNIQGQLFCGLKSNMKVPVFFFYSYKSH